MAQVARERALKRFREGKVEILVATDVAARGIDVQDVTHVINYTCPEDEKTYVHRIGRTGRAGATGVAITFVDWADVTRWKVINKALDLPYDEPQETYSTSEHLFHDQGIPSDAKGRIVPAQADREGPQAGILRRPRRRPQWPWRRSAVRAVAAAAVAAGTGPATQPHTLVHVRSGESRRGDRARTSGDGSSTTGRPAAQPPS